MTPRDLKFRRQVQTRKTHMPKQRKRKPRPVCKKHWQSMRKEALSVMPFWSRPLAGIKITRMLQDKGFVKSDRDCAYCDSPAADAPND